MKKFSIIFLCALVAFAAGCSKKVETEKIPSAPKPSWIEDESLPVPIQFGATGVGVKTRSVFNELPDMYGERLGVLALDVTKDWLGDDESICLDDEIVTCDYDNERGRTMIRFDEPRYYPYMSNYNFSFFSYYRGKNDEKLVYEENRVKLPITGNNWGCQDIVWSRSDADTLFVKKDNNVYVPADRDYDATGYYTGFNASYVRYIAKNHVIKNDGTLVSGDDAKEIDDPSIKIDHRYDTKLPTLAYRHVTTNLKLVAKLDPTFVTSYDLVPVIKEVRLTGDDIHEGADLNVIHKDKTLTGTLDVSGYAKGTITLKDDNGSAVLDITPTHEGVELLNGYFIQPIAENSKIHIEIDLQFESEKGTFNNTVGVNIDTHVAYEAGKYYTYELKLYHREGIEIAVSELAKWENGFSSDDDSDKLLGDEEETPNGI